MSNRIPPIGGRKGKKGVDDIRPDGICYVTSIKSHQKFCESLGNGTIVPNHEEALKNVEQYQDEEKEKDEDKYI